MDNNTFVNLTEVEQNFLRDKAELYKLTYQDLKILIDISRDLHTWGEGTLRELWIDPLDSKVKGKQLKQAIINGITDKWNLLKSDPKDYSGFQGETNAADLKINYVQTENEAIILGDCPVASEKTRCCNLQTLDVVNNCGFDCTYCSIQSFFDGNRVYFQSNLKEKLKKFKLDPGKRYHIGTGQSSDSLMWGNRDGILDLLCTFAGENPNVILELKTKSKNISWLMENDVPSNIIITWSLNTDTIIENEEHLTATLEERLNSARKVADRGIITGFHLHPMVHYKEWEKDYCEIFEKIQELFEPEELAMISLGTLTFIKPVIKQIRNRNIKSKILQMPLEDAQGKLSYPNEIKLKLFRKAYNSFSHEWQDEVFFYLCMEDEKLWQPVFGRSYKSNELFQEDMIDQYFRKTGL